MTGLTHSVAHALRAGNKSWFYSTINYEEKEHFLKFLLQVIDDLSSSGPGPGSRSITVFTTAR